MIETANLSLGIAQRQQRQVVQAVLDYAASHRIPVGGRLPSIRAISEDTGIAPATVTRALKHLARSGVLEAKGRNGTILLRPLSSPNRKTVQRIVLLLGLEGNVSQSIMGGVHDYGLRIAFKNLRPNVDVYSILYSGKEGHEDDDYLENMVHYHHSQVGRNGGTVFLLGNCNRKVKEFFAASSVPAIIMGGNEPSVDLPNVSFDIMATVSEVFDLLEEGDAMPAALIRDCRATFGEHKVMMEQFPLEAQRRGLSDERFTIWDASDSHDLFRGLLIPQLREHKGIRTLITRADDVATWAMRICIELGLHKQIRLISLGGSLLGEWYLPTITGLHRDFYASAEKVLELADILCNGEKPPQRTYYTKAVMVFRESFPNPHLRLEHSPLKL